MEPHVETIAPGLERVALRTPTLPPASTTNSYLWREGSALLVVEPASPYDDAQDQLFALVRERVARGAVLRGALLTHHHADHTGAALAFLERFDAPLLAHPRTFDKLAARGLALPPERLRAVHEGDALLDGAVRALHTPGHAPGHLCLEGRGPARVLVAGDMVASEGTILIDPDDDGSMSTYLAELERLRRRGPAVLLPAHGAPITDADARLRHYIAHRAAREARVLAALEALGAAGGTLRAVVERAYDDTPPALWPLAERSAHAHLVKLEEERLAQRDGARWCAR